MTSVEGLQGGPSGRPRLTPEDLVAATAAGLTEDEGRAAKSTGHSFARYAALREVQTLDDWTRMRAAERAAERDQAEHDRLKTAIRAALDEREKG